jgi:integrase
MGIFPRCGSYYIDFYADGKRVRECVGRVSRRKALNALSVRQAEVVQGKYKFRNKIPNPTFEEFSTAFLEFSKAHKSLRTAEADQTRMKHLLPFFGRYRLDQITPFLVEKYIHERRQAITRRKLPVGPATINRELCVLKHLFNKAIEWSQTERNPVRGIRFLKEPPLVERILSEDEEERLLCASCLHLRIAILIALNTGLRLQEMLHLCRKDIDLVNDMLTVACGKGGKSGKVEINSRLKAELIAFLQVSRSEYLFQNERTGKPILNPKTAFRNAVRRSGIGHIRLHDLRHTFATRLIRRGVDLVTVKNLLRHSTIAMTLRYSHPGAIERRRAVSLLSDGHNMDTTKQNVVELNSVSACSTNTLGG